METVKISWSGGKDSTCATHLHLLKGHNCIICNYMPMFDDETPLLLKNHYEFIMETAERFRKMGGGGAYSSRNNILGFCYVRKEKRY